MITGVIEFLQHTWQIWIKLLTLGFMSMSWASMDIAGISAVNQRMGALKLCQEAPGDMCREESPGMSTAGKQPSRRKGDSLRRHKLH